MAVKSPTRPAFSSKFNDSEGKEHHVVSERCGNGDYYGYFCETCKDDSKEAHSQHLVHCNLLQPDDVVTAYGNMALNDHIVYVNEEIKKKKREESRKQKNEETPATKNKNEEMLDHVRLDKRYSVFIHGEPRSMYWPQINGTVYPIMEQHYGQPRHDSNLERRGWWWSCLTCMGPESGIDWGGYETDLDSYKLVKPGEHPDAYNELDRRLILHLRKEHGEDIPYEGKDDPNPDEDEDDDD
jgi:hypothetical protein